jgi:hypothetical protein
MDDSSEIISRIKFLSKINKGEKISTRYLNNLAVQPDTLITSISRSIFNADSRESSITFIISTIKRGFDLLEKYSKGSTNFEKSMTANLHSDLRACIGGLENIKGTYASDIMFCCKIDTIIQDTLAKLCEVVSCDE